MDVGRLEDKVDRIAESVSNIDKTLMGQAVQLEEHIRRTTLLENDVKPIKEHVQRLKGIAWFLGGLVTAIEISRAFLKG